jgi:hypothetical protein
VANVVIDEADRFTRDPVKARGILLSAYPISTH